MRTITLNFTISDVDVKDDYPELNDEQVNQVLDNMTNLYNNGIFNDSIDEYLQCVVAQLPTASKE